LLATCNNSTLTVLSLATKCTWKNRQTGERESQTTWHKCVSFGRTADYAAILTKGADVQIVGEIQNREYLATEWHEEVDHRDPRTARHSSESSRARPST
jgi:single-stranded DNA-binding protein